VEEAGVKSDQGECGDCQPECCSLEKRRTSGGLDSGIQTTISGGWDGCVMRYGFSLREDGLVCRRV
jgi:hypothetical protein